MANDCYVYKLILHHFFRFVSITRFCSSQNLLSEKEGNSPNCSACPDQFFVPESLVMRQKGCRFIHSMQSAFEEKNLVEKKTVHSVHSYLQQKDEARWKMSKAHRTNVS